MRVLGASLIGLLLFAGCAADTGEPVGRTASDLVAVCGVEATGTLDAGDTFAGTVTVFAGGAASGPWSHSVQVGTADCPGNGRRVGHDRHRGRGHDIGRGRGHCEHAGPIFSELVGEVTSGTCSINGHSLADLFGTGTWDGDPVSFAVTPIHDLLNGDSYSITITDGSGTVYSVSSDVATGDIVVVGL